MEQLLLDYQGRLAKMQKMLDGFEYECPNNPDYTRVKTKVNCYKLFIAELEQKLNVVQIGDVNNIAITGKM